MDQHASETEAAFILRAVDTRLESALEEIEAAAADIGEAIHGVRKRLKAARALLWALEPLPGREARKARRRLRTAAGLLAAPRDAEVMAATAAANGFRRVARRLRAAAPQDDTVPLARAGRKIAAVRGKLWRVDTAGHDGPLLQEAIRRSYRQARHAWRCCRDDRPGEALHGWRKKVKRLFYLVEVVPGHDAVLTDRLNRLGDLLGLDHDNVVLAGRVGAMAGGRRKKRAKIARTRERIQNEAFALAATVFAAKPRAFAAQPDSLRRWSGEGAPDDGLWNSAPPVALAPQEGDMAKKHGPSIKDDDTYEALRREGASKGKAARIANAAADASREPSKKGGRAPPYEERSKKELYALARARGIDGRSSMDKGELISALRGT